MRMCTMRGMCYVQLSTRTNQTAVVNRLHIERESERETQHNGYYEYVGTIFVQNSRYEKLIYKRKE